MQRMKKLARAIIPAIFLTSLLYAWHLYRRDGDRVEPTPPTDSVAVGYKAISTPPEATASSGQASALKPKGISGGDTEAEAATEVRLSVPLEPIYTSALRAKVPEDRASAFRLATLCLAKEAALPTPTKSDVARITGVSLEDAGRILLQREDAISRVLSFCSSGNASNFLNELRKLPKPALGPITKSAHVFANSPIDQQQNFQAFTQLLANPLQYPTQFDAWLDSGAFLALAKRHGLNAQQTIDVGNALFERFVSNPDLLQIRKWSHCIDQYACNEAGDNKKVLSVAREIESHMRTQRWDLLLVK
ncbi:hypothetical protein [Roseateles sp. LKC17W]|uniref:Uncharacterized protein n=1 Tax=Pelomonas margarita TaxID=3299031 RepID=A0ABW7FME6_9BURK